MRPLSLVVILPGLILWMAACGGASEEGAGQEQYQDALTVEQVYGQVAEALTRPGEIYHAVIEAEANLGETSQDGTEEYWVDAGRDLARLERSSLEEEDTSIASAGAVYFGGSPVRERLSSKRPADLCHGANSAVSLLLQCKGEDEKASSVEFGRYRDQDALVIKSDVVTEGEDQTIRFTQRLYVDRNTFLPLAVEIEGTYETDVVESLYALGQYRGDFVSLDSLSPDFFDPASIGYVEIDPLQPLDRPDLGVTVYWLGERFSPGGDLPELEVAWVEVPSCSVGGVKTGPGSLTCGPGYKLILYYRLVGDEFGPPMLGIQEWTAADWEAAQLQGDFSRVRIVSFPETVAFVDAPETYACGEQPCRGTYGCGEEACPDNPFDNPAALEIVAAALRVRQ